MKILVVDDEAAIRTELQEILTEEGYTALTAQSIAEALAKIADGVDLALVDIKLGTENGLDLLGQIKTQFPGLPVVMITGHGSVALASEAFKLGAHDFLEKPLRLIQIRTCVRNALESLTLKRKLAQSTDSGGSKPVIASALMQQVYGQAKKLSNMREPVVVMGPSGSGKELLARALHFEGVRAAQPFIATNAASMPVTLAEDELFGHEKGAFTGADRRREGCLERANGGTLFLDEIGDMDMQIQAKLLRVLEDQSFMRLGGSAPVRIDVRLVCATHKDLQSLVAQGKFRHDLWYRISAFVLEIPGLDKRKGDVPVMAQQFLAAACADLGVSREFDESGLTALAYMNFPGNVRELKHVVARLAVFSEVNKIDAACVGRVCQAQTISVPAVAAASGITVGEFRAARDEFEMNFFRTLIGSTDGNITAAARIAGMAQSNLSRKLKELGLRQ